MATNVMQDTTNTAVIRASTELRPLCETYACLYLFNVFPTVSRRHFKRLNRHGVYVTEVIVQAL